MFYWEILFQMYIYFFNVKTVLPCLPDFHSWLLVGYMGAMLFIYILFIFVGYVHCSTYCFS